MGREIYRGILEVVEIDKASKGYAIKLDTPRKGQKFKSENFFFNPPKPMIVEFDLKDVPQLWCKLGIIITVLNDKKEEEVFKYGKESKKETTEKK